jgi:glycosyltransferase involved in cell wall biosynthesis
MKETVNITEWDKLSVKEREAVTKIEFTGTKKPSDILHRPTMGFVTMCKNEEHCIGKTLNAVKSYVDYVVVADNGSTDNTFDIVRKYFKDTGLPGAWHIDEWLGFDKNKTLMMSYIKDKTDYVIHLDADDFLVGDLAFYFENAGSDLYEVLNKRGALRYWCYIIYNNKLTWRFCGVAHTVVKAEDKDNIQRGSISEDMVWVDNAGTGTRALNPEKFLGDALLLAKQYDDTLIVDTDGLNSRSVFYCAQSYKDQDGKYLIDSLKWYKKYLTLKNTWFEEEYECLVSIAFIKKRLNDTFPDLGYTFTQDDIANEYLAAINLIDDRAEAYLGLGKIYNNTQQFEKAYDILQKGKLISLDVTLEKYNLFIVHCNYELWFNDEISVACYYLNRTDEGIALIEEVLNDPAHIDTFDHYESNLALFKKLK